VVAGIGLAVGSGLYFGAVVTTALTLVALMIFSRIEHAMIRKDWYRTVHIETKDGLGQLKAVRDVLAEYHADINDFEVERTPAGAMVLKIGLKLYTSRYNEQLIADIGRLDGVAGVKWAAE